MEGIKNRLRDYGAMLISEESLVNAVQNRKLKFDYKCEKGHINHKTIASFYLTKICRVCSGRDPEDSKRRFAEIVQEKGWNTDLEKYKGSSVKIGISCSLGHFWEAKPCNVLRGQGCSRCSQKSTEQTQEKLVEVVKHHEGKFDSTKYKNARTKILFTCRDGHEWETTPAKVLQGHWCARCSNNSIDMTKEKLVKIVDGHEGKVDMSLYVSNKTKMPFECKEGHRWSTIPKSVLNGCWCRVCSAKTRTTLTMEEFAEQLTKAVEVWGGSFDMEKLNTTRMEFTCREGHVWSTRPYHVLRGTQCGLCMGNCTEIAKAALVEHVRDKGGQVDISHYRGATTKMPFKCSQGHEWSTTPNSIMSSHTWCQKCAGNCPDEAKTKLERKVKEHGGSCHMDEYVNTNTRMTFTCDKGHSWKTTPGSITSGTWCAICCGVSKEQTIQRLIQCVAERKGKVDIAMYKRSDSNVLFTCELGHEWLARPGNVLANLTWCPLCLQSKGEREIRTILEKINVPFTSQKVLKGTQLKADFFVESKKLIIEFDGEQHFTLQWREKKTPQTRVNDLRKNAWCVENNVHLLRVPWWTFDVEKAILEALSELSHGILLIPKEDYFD